MPRFEPSALSSALNQYLLVFEYSLKRQRDEFLSVSVGIYSVLVEVCGEVASCLTSLSQGGGDGGVSGGFARREISSRP